MARAVQQQQRTIDISPKRGVIYDRNGVPLAMSIQADSVFAVPNEVPDNSTTAHLLADIAEHGVRLAGHRLPHQIGEEPV